MMDKSARQPWIAALLTLLTRGLGHIYSGEARRGLLLFCFELVLVISASASIIFVTSRSFLILVILICFAYLVFCIVDAAIIARRNQFSYSLKKYNKLYIYLAYIFIASLLITPIVVQTVKSNLLEAFKLPSGAMIPTMLVGDRFFVNKLIYKMKDPHRGDIVVFPYPENASILFVMRLIGAEGDVIEIKNKQLYINGKQQSEPYIINIDQEIVHDEPRDNFGPFKIPVGSLFFMGDNRDNSRDSRFWGVVPKETVKGKAISLYWSWDSSFHRVRWDRIGKPLN